MEKLTPGKLALLDTGKKLFVESIEVSRKYSEFMISLSIKSIPIYIGILVFIRKDQSFFEDLCCRDKFLLISPAILFLISMVVFIISFNPKKQEFNLDNLTSLKETIVITTNRRERLNKIGTAAFITSVVFAIVSLFLVIF